MSKTSKKEQVQGVDPTLRKEGVNLLNLFKALASSAPYQFYSEPTVAAFTPKQEAAFNMGDAAASAFGFDTPTRTAMPDPVMSAGGIAGYSPVTEARAGVANLDPLWLDALRRFFSPEGLGKDIPDYGNPKTSGGKK